jgi:hypothetical protein
VNESDFESDLEINEVRDEVCDISFEVGEENIDDENSLQNEIDDTSNTNAEMDVTVDPPINDRTNCNARMDVTVQSQDGKINIYLRNLCKF